VALTSEDMIDTDTVAVNALFGSYELLFGMLGVFVNTEIATLAIVALAIPTTESNCHHLVRFHEIVIAERCHSFEVLKVVTYLICYFKGRQFLSNMQIF
jgi:hypothetical protein